MKQFPDSALNVPRPRPTRKRRNAGWWFSDGCVGIFFAFMLTPIWLFFALRITGETVVLVAGHTIQAPVVAARFINAKGGGHLVSYRYGPKAEDVDEINVLSEDYAALPVGSLLPVKTFGTGALISSRVPLVGSPTAKFCYLWFQICFFGFVLYAVWKAHFLAPRRRHWLLVHGTPAKGQVTKVYGPTGKGRRYAVSYAFFDGLGHAQKSQCGSLESRPNMEEGDAVSVLFDPNNPHSSTIYELLPEEVDTGSAPK